MSCQNYFLINLFAADSTRNLFSPFKSKQVVPWYGYNCIAGVLLSKDTWSHLYHRTLSNITTKGIKKLGLPAKMSSSNDFVALDLGSSDKAWKADLPLRALLMNCKVTFF